MRSLVVSLVVASVSTRGGCGIMRAEKHAERIGAWPGVALAFCTMAIGVMLLDRLAEGGGYAPTGRSRTAEANRPILVSAPTNKGSAGPSAPPLLPR